MQSAQPVHLQRNASRLLAGRVGVLRCESSCAGPTSQACVQAHCACARMYQQVSNCMSLGAWMRVVLLLITAREASICPFGAMPVARKFVWCG